MQSLNEFDEGRKKQLNESLEEETKRKAEEASEKAQIFAKELQVEVEGVAVQIDAIREKIRKNHVSGSGDCILKANITQYEKCVPQINVEQLKKLLEVDIEVCKEIPKRIGSSLELVQ